MSFSPPRQKKKILIGNNGVRTYLMGERKKKIFTLVDLWVMKPRRPGGRGGFDNNMGVLCDDHGKNDVGPLHPPSPPPKRTKNRSWVVF